MPTVADRIREGNDYVARKIYALEEATVRELFEQYRRAYERIAQDLIRTVSMYDGKFETIAARNYLLGQIMGNMAALDETAAATILRNMTEGYQAAGQGTAWLLDTSFFDKYIERPSVMPLLPTEAIRAQLLAPYVGKTFGEHFTDSRADFELAMKRSLVQAQIEGEGIYQVQKRIAETMGIDITRRTKQARMANRGNFYRTQLIARTEILRASNLGARAIYAANDDVLRGYEHLTAKDERVCERCGPLDGRVFDFDGNPIDGKGAIGESEPPPIHPQCRCTIIPALLTEFSHYAERNGGPRETYSQWREKRGLPPLETMERRGKPAPKAKLVK